MAEQYQNHSPNFQPVKNIQIIVSVVLYQISAIGNHRKQFYQFRCLIYK